MRMPGQETTVPAAAAMRHPKSPRTEERRDFIGGVLIVIGICWPFVVSSLLPIPTWVFWGFALLAGVLRFRVYPRERSAVLPLLAFCLVLLLFAGIGVAFAPLPDYGVEKFWKFCVMAVLAVLGAGWQAPLTPALARGMRWALLATLLLTFIVAIMYRDLFLQTEQYGVAELRGTFSVTGFPLAIGLAACCVIPTTMGLTALLGSGVGLNLLAGLEIFVRGRFQAILLCVLAGVIILGPPWKNLFWRILVCGVLVILGLAVYVNILPLLGDSFRYLTWVDPESFGGRAPLFQTALSGFLAHPLGQGIGSFMRNDTMYLYPHNIVLESAYELGILGLLTIGWVYLRVAGRAWQLWNSPLRFMGAMLVVIFLHMLKAGDISTQGFQWVYLYLLLVATPVSSDWVVADQ